MRDALTLVLRASSSLLVLSGFLALSSVRQYGAAVLLIPLALLPAAPIGAWLERHYLFWRILKRMLVVLYICFIPFSLSTLGLMDAVIALVIFILAYLLLGEKNARTYYEIYLMSFFLLLAAVVQSPEPLIAIALLLYGISAVWAFTTLRMQVEKRNVAGCSRTEIAPLQKSMSWARPGNIFDLGLFLSLSLLSLLSVLLTVTFFLLIPRVEAGWLGRRDFRQSITGLSETVQLRGGTNIAEDQTVVMHVQFPEEPEGVFSPSSALYWRTSTLSRFSGDEWSRRGLQKHYEPGIPDLFGRITRHVLRSNGLEEGRDGRTNARGIRQIIYMDEVPTQGMPCLDLPQSIRLLGEPSNVSVSWDQGIDFTLQLQTRGTRRQNYEAYSDMAFHDLESLRNAPMDYEYMEPRDYSLLTYHELLPETVTLAQNITAEYDAPYDKVLALERFLSSADFSYTLDVPDLPPTNGIDAFIHDIRRGHCELFASALALMVRSLGIPARVVSGYRGGEYMPGDRAYLVRANMAHLWVEVLLAKVGWVRFDPSPRSVMDATGIQRIRMVWALYALRSKMFWYQSVIGFEGRIRLDQWRWPWSKSGGRNTMPPPHSAQDIRETEATTLERDQGIPYRPILIFAAVISCLAGMAFYRFRRKRRSRFADIILTQEQRRIRRIYLKFMRKLAGLGIEVANKSSGEILKELLQMQIPDEQQTITFIRRYNEIRFGKRPFANQEENTLIRFVKGLSKTE